MSRAQALEKLVEEVCGLGRVDSGDMDRALLALVHGTSFGNYWPKGKSQAGVYLKSPHSANHQDPLWMTHHDGFSIFWACCLAGHLFSSHS